LADRLREPRLGGRELAAQCRELRGTLFRLIRSPDRRIALLAQADDQRLKVDDWESRVSSGFTDWLEPHARETGTKMAID
jgi:hypothetical protein